MMPRRAGPTPRGFAAAFALIMVSLPLGAADNPRAWIERMGDAVERLNYEGTLVHLIGDETSVIQIVHRVDGGRVTERITSRDAGREIIRDGEEVTCILADQRIVLVEERDGLNRAQSPLRNRLPRAGMADAYYHLAMAGSDRVAGRDARLIAIRPKDSFRYGYRVWVDQLTAMPLKTQLIDERGVPLEQILFTEIELPERIPDAALRPTVPTQSFVTRRSVSSEPASMAAPGGDWWATRLPAGFSLAVRKARAEPAAARGLQHLVYSDGLATVSLFIEPAVAASEQAEGLSQIGAANAFTIVRDGYMITAVGEVPARTVEMLAMSTRPGTLPATPVDPR